MRFVGRKMIETGIKLLLIFQIFVGGKEIKFRLPATVRMSFHCLMILQSMSTVWNLKIYQKNTGKYLLNIYLKKNE